jgi:predicted nucleotidyltransferase
MHTLSELSIDIHPVTQEALNLFIEKVKEHEGDNLSKIILFGSVARGEANEDSDIDVLVILQECTFKKKKAVWDISVDVMWDMDDNKNAYIQAIPLSEEQSSGLDFYALMHNINREWVFLYGAK